MSGGIGRIFWGLLVIRFERYGLVRENKVVDDAYGKPLHLSQKDF